MIKTWLMKVKELVDFLLQEGHDDPTVLIEGNILVVFSDSDCDVPSIWDDVEVVHLKQDINDVRNYEDEDEEDEDEGEFGLGGDWWKQSG